MAKVKVNLDKTIQKLLDQEDTDGDKKITVEDKGKGIFKFKDKAGEKHVVEGTYRLSNLLQELNWAKLEGKSSIRMDLVEAKPTDRISYQIKNRYWKGLTRRIDATGLDKLFVDTKSSDGVNRIYVSAKDPLAYNYFKVLKKNMDIPFEVVKLPEDITPEYVLSIERKPGILSLKIVEDDGKMEGVPFVVPGGRFNEMYGWDTYFENIGLLVDEQYDLALGNIENFDYQIEHYGKILNANRSYYLTRSQPPFFTRAVLEYYESIPAKKRSVKWLKARMQTALKDYFQVWMNPKGRLTSMGLNVYRAEGIGIPLETEAAHFDVVLKPHADKLGMDLREFEKAYANREVDVPELDEYFVHDRSVRESGHDTTYRLDGNCADVATVDLNSLLYQYEKDLAYAIKQYIKEPLKYDGTKYEEAYFNDAAKRRRKLVDEYLWNDKKGAYFDYDTKNEKQSNFLAATTFYPMWAKMASDSQAKSLVKKILPKFIEKGGLVSSTEESRGPISEDRPHRQWDFPNGWAPHQMILWKGLLNYGYEDEAQEMIYRWLWTITKNAHDYNGTIPEKYDVQEATHKVFSEYGNVGTEFDYITTEGFGWMNASYQYGLSLLNKKFRKKLDNLVEPEKVFKSKHKSKN